MSKNSREDSSSPLMHEILKVRRRGISFAKVLNSFTMRTLYRYTYLLLLGRKLQTYFVLGLIVKTLDLKIEYVVILSLLWLLVQLK